LVPALEKGAYREGRERRARGRRQEKDRERGGIFKEFSTAI